MSYWNDIWSGEDWYFVLIKVYVMPLKIYNNVYTWELFAGDSANF